MCTILSAYKYGINVNLFLVINLLFEFLFRSFLLVFSLSICFWLFFYNSCDFCVRVECTFSFSLFFFLPDCLCICPSCARQCKNCRDVCVIQACPIKCVLLTFAFPRSHFNFDSWTRCAFFTHSISKSGFRLDFWFTGIAKYIYRLDFFFTRAFVLQTHTHTTHEDYRICRSFSSIALALPLSWK